MGGGLMQLVAYGAQDIYLTGNPQITFFKVVYRRHTNFSMEAIQQTFIGTPQLSSSVTAIISRNGDLVHRMYLEYNPRELLGTVKADKTLASNLSHNLINEVELEIGGQRIDKHYGHWLQVWSELQTRRKFCSWHLAQDLAKQNQGDQHQIQQVPPESLWISQSHPTGVEAEAPSLALHSKG